MLRTWALQALFDENLDKQAATGIFLTTLGGNVAAKDSKTPNAKTKHASALGALSWRIQAALLTGNSPAKTARVQPLQTLHLTHSNGVLKSLVVLLDGEALAVEYVLEGLLVGVLCGAVKAEQQPKEQKKEKQKSKKVGVMEGVHGHVEGGEDGRVQGGVEGTPGDDGDEAHDEDEDKDGEEINDDTAGEEVDEEEEEEEEEEGEEDEEDEEVDEEEDEEDEEEEKEEEDMWKTVEVKASAMALYLRRELKDFRMPAGLEMHLLQGK
ncbi:hypothetical protein MMC19_000350 [Ptychographa xylographoides]|nr:hypothetical protein [Ptychographa xylographoides]